MVAKLEPLKDGPARWRWFAEARDETRARHPHFYWCYDYDGHPKFYWHETEVSEQEYRANFA